MAKELDFENFLQTIADYTGMEKCEIQKETNVYNDLGMDSLGMFSLGMYLIKTYGIRLPLSAVSSIESVEDMYKALIKYKKS